MNRVLQSITAIFAGATLAVALPSGTASAQNLGEAEISTLRASFENTGSTRALQNVLTHNSNIKENAANFSNEGKLDHYFKYRVDVKGITDQKSSGRCWMFTSMNALRPAVMQKYNLGEFDFSHNYNYFWDILEKSNLFLENILATIEKPMDDRTVVFLFKSPVDDGGVWNSFYNIATKYGVVPQSVMPETAHSNNTAQLGSIINERLRAGGYELRQLAEKREADLSRIQGERDIAKSKAILAESIRIKKLSILKDIYRVLALCLGEPPTEFTWRYKDKNGDIKELKSTPLEFFKSIEPAGYTPEEYIMTMNDPTREYYKVYEIENYRNTMEGINWKYLNLPNEELKSAALASIKANEPLYCSCDVSKQLNRKEGTLDLNNYNVPELLGIEINMDKKARILTRQSGSSHAMLLIGCDTDQNDKPVKWEFENSWGSSYGHNGYLTFTDEWFNEYLFRLVINKRYLSPKAIEALGKKSTKLPMWDYMF